MAVLAAMGLLGADQTFVHESIIGTRFRGRVTGETTVGDHPAILPEIEGEAYITGENVFLIDEADPLRHGFRLLGCGPRLDGLCLLGRLCRCL